MAVLLRIIVKEILIAASCLPGPTKVIGSVSSLSHADFFLLIRAKDGGPLPHSVMIAESRIGIVILEADD